MSGMNWSNLRHEIGDLHDNDEYTKVLILVPGPDPEVYAIAESLQVIEGRLVLITGPAFSRKSRKAADS